jgi:hypothetical protein
VRPTADRDVVKIEAVYVERNERTAEGKSRLAQTVITIWYRVERVTRPLDLRTRTMVDRWIRGTGREVYLWEVDGRAVSLVGLARPHRMASASPRLRPAC